MSWTTRTTSTASMTGKNALAVCSADPLSPTITGSIRKVQSMKATAAPASRASTRAGSSAAARRRLSMPMKANATSTYAVTANTSGSRTIRPGGDASAPGTTDRISEPITKKNVAQNSARHGPRLPGCALRRMP
jgi:hypothetical protein